MYGLVNRAIEVFVIETHGQEDWQAITAASGCGHATFESLLNYPDEVTVAIFDAAVVQLAKPQPVLLEDIGTFLVTAEIMAPIRRLLRFGGQDFPEFLHSLDDLPGRARLAVPELRLPYLELVEEEELTFTLTVTYPVVGFAYVMQGILRAMADDYGTLALFEHMGVQDRTERLRIQLFDTNYASGRDFDLMAGTA